MTIDHDSLTPLPRRNVRDVVLVVDDDRYVREATADLLEMEGYEVTVAEHGHAGLVLLGAGLRPAVIVLDLMMPMMNGWQFRCAQVRDPALADIPIVVTTAGQVDMHRFGAVFGDAPLLRKPVDGDALLASIADACRAARPFLRAGGSL